MTKLRLVTIFIVIAILLGYARCHRDSGARFLPTELTFLDFVQAHADYGQLRRTFGQGQTLTSRSSDTYVYRG